MAIIRRKEVPSEQNLYRTTEQSNAQIEPPKYEFNKTVEGKKLGFIRSTIAELRKVNWPTAKYTFMWSAIVLLFTLVASISFSAIDRVFQESMGYAQCAANFKKQGDSADKDLDQCKTDFVNKLTYKQ